MDTDSSPVTYPPIPATAPFLFENQHLPFAGDIHMEGEFLKLRDQFGLTVAVETGTCYGSTALWLRDHFQSVVTMEINEPFLNVALARFKANGKDIVARLVDSAQEMPRCAKAMKEAKHNAIFFLDAHFEAHCPLLQELAAIAAAGIKPVIVIHDFQVPGRPDLGFDTWEGQPFRFSWIRPSLDAIYGANRYSHYFNHEATGARRGVIYIHPLP